MLKQIVLFRLENWRYQLTSDRTYDVKKFNDKSYKLEIHQHLDEDDAEKKLSIASGSERIFALMRISPIKVYSTRYWSTVNHYEMLGPIFSQGTHLNTTKRNR